MTLEDIKTWLSTVVNSPNYFAGKGDYSKDNFIAVMDTTPIKAHMALGGVQYSSYDVKCVAFLIHWGKYQPAAEKKADEIYNALNGNPNNAIIGSQRVIDFKMRFGGPLYLGTDDTGIYEYTVYTNIYYQKSLQM